MTLVVEDGTGKTDAESYISVADADAYFSNRNMTTWEGSDAEKEAALRRATQYIDTVYGERFRGYVVSTTQALLWPRVWTNYAPGINQPQVISPLVPKQVKDATAECALRYLTDDMMPDQDRGGAIQSETVGPLSVTYADGAPSGKTFDWIDRLMSFVIIGSGGGVIERA